MATIDSCEFNSVLFSENSTYLDGEKFHKKFVWSDQSGVEKIAKVAQNTQLFSHKSTKEKKSFWQKHKKIILITGGVILDGAAVTAAIILTAGVAALVADSALCSGVAALAEGLNSDSQVSSVPSNTYTEIPKLDRNLPVFSSEMMPLQQNWGHWLFESQYMDYIADPEVLPLKPQYNTSMTFRTTGNQQPTMRIGGINGIGNSLCDAVLNSEYLKKFTKELAVEWVYNCSNNPILDGIEAGLVNMSGYSPITEKLLRENWLVFHEENKNNPHAKYLQNCHSQGTIHVKNALEGLPKEVRERIIVIAIAPATLIPTNLCYKSYNYASKADIVPNAEIYLCSAETAIVNSLTGYKGRLLDERLQKAIANRGELIILEPHPEAEGMDHNYRSRTYFKVLFQHIDDYLLRKGIYND